MSWIITKYFITAAVVVLISEAAKRSDKLGGLIAALTLVTILALNFDVLMRSNSSKKSKLVMQFRLSCYRQ